VICQGKLQLESVMDHHKIAGTSKGPVALHGRAQ